MELRNENIRNGSDTGTILSRIDSDKTRIQSGLNDLQAVNDEYLRIPMNLNSDSDPI